MPRPSKMAKLGRDDLRQAINRFGGARAISCTAGMVPYQEWFLRATRVADRIEMLPGRACREQLQILSYRFERPAEWIQSAALTYSILWRPKVSCGKAKYVGTIQWNVG
jgi:hypothetical protein